MASSAVTGFRGRTRPAARAVAAGAALGVLLLLALPAGSPALAAAPVAQASATAVRLTVAGTPTDSGSYSVTNDGTQQTSHGDNQPTVGGLGGQSFLSAGVLAQDATTSVQDRKGSSQACAGLAGPGGTVAAAGAGSCLAGGQTLDLGAGTIDLGSLQLVGSDLLQGLDQQLQTALQPLLAQLLPPLQSAVQTALTQVGNPRIVLDLGALQSSCRAAIGTASGDASLADASAYVEVAGQRLDLLSLPANPAPNTKVATNLDKVVQLVLDALRTQLTTALAGALGPLGAAIDQVAVVNSAVATLAAQLAPLEQNVLEGTLNAQSRPSADAISVTALDLRVLPVAAQFGVDLLHLEVGNTTCGPSAELPAPPKPTRTPHPQHPKPPVPTSIPAGVGSAPQPASPSWLGLAGLGLLGLATACGTVSYRRATRR